MFVRSLISVLIPIFLYKFMVVPKVVAQMIVQTTPFFYVIMIFFQGLCYYDVIN